MGRKTDRRTGKRIWHPTTTARGKMTAHPELSIRHARGTRGVLRMIIAMTRIHATSHENQKRLKIFGTSLKKLERSTSFLVAPQVMLYENVLARMAVDTGIESPPKKKKLQEHQDWDMASEGASTHKNGIHIMFWKKALTYRSVVISTQPM